MNDIMNRGFVSPYIKFNFATGTIDTIPHRHFISMEHNRSVDQASSFQLSLIYVPGQHGEEYANDLHQLLLTSVNQPVTFQYGYITPGAGLQLQDKWYRGIYTQYTENIGSDGTLSYTISGVAESVNLDTPQAKVSNFLAERKKGNDNVQPSSIVKFLLEHKIPNSNLFEFFEFFKKEIDDCDEKIPVKSINVEDGTIREVLCGTYNADGTANVKGFANHSHLKVDADASLSMSLVSDRDIQVFESQYSIKNRYISSQITQAEKSAHNFIQKYRTIPFVCYFDDVIGGPEGTDPQTKGTFYYGPKYSRQVTNIYMYNFGNNFIDSDVISFSANNDCIVAMSSVGSLNSISSGIGDTGESVASSHNVLQQTGFSINSYDTITGFDESRFLTQTTMANALNFPFSASMTVVGQTKTNNLLDKINVTVMVNGVINQLLTGTYIIMGITDNLSDSGFTTTFDLQKDISSEETKESNVYANSDDSPEADVEKAYANDYR